MAPNQSEVTVEILHGRYVWSSCGPHFAMQRYSFGREVPLLRENVALHDKVRARTGLVRYKEETALAVTYSLWSRRMLRRLESHATFYLHVNGFEVTVFECKFK